MVRDGALSLASTDEAARVGEPVSTDDADGVGGVREGVSGAPAAGEEASADARVTATRGVRERTGPSGGGRPPACIHVPAIRLENLGDPAFCKDLGIRYPYLAGSMANGIASCEMVEAMSGAGMLGFFGAGGLLLGEVEAAIDRLTRALGDKAFGFNLLHSPNEPDLEAGAVDLYLRRGVRLVEASAYLGLTLPLVRYRVHGIHLADPHSRGRLRHNARRSLAEGDGAIVTPNRVIAKVSRVEVASKFLAPPPESFLRELVQSRDITEEQARLASRVPVAQDLTAEADSGGHTDNRPALTLLPTMLALRDRMQEQYNYDRPLRVGLAGGIATPASAAAAFAMGAAYVLTGSVNQACIESGASDAARQMLAEAGQADVAMAPAADMFEMGVNVQVLKRGTMFPMRAAKLYEIYQSCASLDDIKASDRATLEKAVFKGPLEEIWNRTREFFLQRDRAQVERAEKDAKHKMALVFRWYLGQSPRWANSGDASRRIDYQIWCGPAMGAFNEWAKGSFLERPENRRVVTVAMNILYGAAVLLRANVARSQGCDLGRETLSVRPLTLEMIADRVREEER